MRFRLYPTPEQEPVMARHCADARYVWNLALEQANYWRRGWKGAPGRAERSRQLTEARTAFDWLAAGSQMVQQQALRDFDWAMRGWWAGTHRHPTWRKAGVNEGFRVVGLHAQRIRQINRRWSEARIPKVGWVRFRRTRSVPDAKSYRVTLDRSGRWHIAFAAIPVPLMGPGNDSIIGIDRGVTISLALSDGTTYQVPEDQSVKRLQRKLSRAKRGANRRRKVKARLARRCAQNKDRRKDWVEKSSTTIARSYDLIRIEDLRIRNMTRSAKGTVAKPGKNVRAKAGLNRAISGSGWGAFARRLQDKAQGRVEKVPPAFTSQRCSGCGHIAAESRENQSRFCCVACGYTDNADLNAAKNIAAGHAVTARRGQGVVDLPLKREPQRELVS